MAQSHGLLETIAGVLVPVHRDGHKFIAIAVVLAVLSWWLIWEPLGWLFFLLALGIAYFFRDPDRVTPLREGLLVSAADGEITSNEKVIPPSELGLGSEERVRVSTFLSVLDVHINRAPIAGKILRSFYVPGAFLNAAADKASEENERRAIVIQTPGGDEIAVVQIAGLIARRIVAFAHDGDSVGIGQRFGLIRFGSRVDIYLPPGKTSLVSLGQRAVAGETVIADLKSDEPEREARRS